jgi:hypothetical protein
LPIAERIEPARGGATETIRPPRDSNRAMTHQTPVGAFEIKFAYVEIKMAFFKYYVRIQKKSKFSYNYQGSLA